MSKKEAKKCSTQVSFYPELQISNVKTFACLELFSKVICFSIFYKKFQPSTVACIVSEIFGFKKRFSKKAK